MSPPLPHESWLAFHLHARECLRAQFPAFARHAWRRWRFPALLLAAVIFGGAGALLWQAARFGAPAEKPLSLPALSPIPDLTPKRELPASPSAPPLPSSLPPSAPPAAPPLKESR